MTHATEVTRQKPLCEGGNLYIRGECGECDAAAGRGVRVLPDDQSKEGLGACPISRATELELEPNGRTEDGNRGTGEEGQGGHGAARSDAVRAGGAEPGARGGDVAQHEVAEPAPGPGAPAVPRGVRVDTPTYGEAVIRALESGTADAETQQHAAAWLRSNAGVIPSAEPQGEKK